MGFQIVDAISGLEVLMVYSDCAIGTGKLVVDSSGDVTWTDPAGASTSATTIADGYLVKLSTATPGSILVRRDQEAQLTAGTMLVQCDGLTSPIEELAACNAAITKVRAAIRAGSGDEYIQRAALEELLKEKRELELEVRSALGQNPTVSEIDISY